VDERRWQVPPDLGGERLDVVLARLARVSRTRARSWIDTGEVEVDDRPARAADRVRPDQVVTARIPPLAEGIVPEPDVPFRVVAEDDALLVVDKPPGVVVHPGAGNERGTLVAGLLARFPELARLGAERRWGLVHRIDKDTSGLLLVAKQPEVFDALQQALRERRISRTYLALVEGRVAAATGTIDAPLDRDPRHPTRVAVRPGGRQARTHYRRLAVWDRPPRTLLELRLETGRTHQIRVHLQAIGHPIVGDRVYGHPATPPGRTFLHAHRLTFRHPTTGATVTVEAPLPDDLAAVLESLGPPDRGEVPEAARESPR